jgi:hypothetical protein
MMHAVALAGVIRQQLGPKTVLRAASAEDAEHLIHSGRPPSGKIRSIRRFEPRFGSVIRRAVPRSP